MNYETLQTVSAVLYLLGVVSVMAAVIMFFRWHITDTILSKTGIAKKRAKKQMQMQLKTQSEHLDPSTATTEYNSEDYREEKIGLPIEPVADNEEETGDTNAESETGDTNAESTREFRKKPRNPDTYQYDGDERIENEEDDTGLLVEDTEDDNTGLLQKETQPRQFVMTRLIVLAQDKAGEDRTGDIVDIHATNPTDNPQQA